MANETELMEKIVSLSKRRGFVFPGSEIYGGLESTWDYGPLGMLLKNNVKAQWWKAVLQERDDMVGLDASILMHPTAWVASGHVEGFSDPLVDCKSCKKRFRADDIKETKCPECGGEFTEVRKFNLMFKTFMGPVEDEAAVIYMRPETAQGIFVNFKNVQTSSRKKLPFGIAQIGKSFRNEITPGKFTFRTREFEQMEIEYFVKPDEADKLYDKWVDDRYNWYFNLGVKKENLRLRPHDPDELAHYAKACKDIEYKYPWGWAEVEGIANRTDFDLSQHQKVSGKEMTYFDEEKNEHYIPYVIEPSGGVDRATLTFLVDSYAEDKAPDEKGKMEERVVLRLDKRLAPYKIAILPLSKKEPIINMANKISKDLRKHFMCDYDDRGSIGKRYRRQDEVGTPFAVTIDFQTIEEDNKVTIRDRDTMKQERVPVDNLVNIFREKLES